MVEDEPQEPSDQELVAKLETDWHNLTRQQRVAGFDELQHGLAGRPRQADQLWRSRTVLFGQGGRGANEVDLRQPFNAAGQLVCLLADFLAQRAQNTFDLALFVQAQCAPAIAHLDRGQGFDEQGRPARRLVVDDTWHLAARFGADGDDVAPRALGDHRVLNNVAKWRRGHDLAQTRDQPIVGAA